MVALERSIRKVVFVIFILSTIQSWSQRGVKHEVAIAQQFGLGYAPLIVAQERGLIERRMPAASVKWVQMGSGGAIRDGMAAGTIDIGSMGVPPFLIAWSKGIDVKVFFSICEMPNRLQTNRADIKSLSDFKPGMKIAVPSPGSIQHILLSMGAERQLGNARALDNQIVAMAHPDGVNALINNVDIVGHFTSPPYLFKETEKPNIHTILDGRDAFGGDYTFLVAIATRKFKEEQPELFKAVFDAFMEAKSWILANPGEAAKLLEKPLGIPASELYVQLTAQGAVFTENPRGMIRFLDFMLQAGYVKKTTKNVGDLIWETLDPSKAN